jgi:hypothetical protein
VLSRAPSALLFGSTSVAIRVGCAGRRRRVLGALVSALVGFVVCVVAAFVAGEGVRSATRCPSPGGLFAPGVSQVLFFRAIEDAGAARVSVVVGTAPLVSVCDRDRPPRRAGAGRTRRRRGL